MDTYLLVLGTREGLAWVISNGRMAFSESNASRVEALKPGDRLFLYTTRGAFGNPALDRGRIIGEAEVKTPVRRRARSLEIGGRTFTHECGIHIESLARYRAGLELTPLVKELHAFPNPNRYSARLRRPLLRLPDEDARLIRRRMKALVEPPARTRRDYVPDSRR